MTVTARLTGEPGVVLIGMPKCVVCGADRAPGHAVAVFSFRSDQPHRRRGKSISPDAVQRAALYCFCRACKQKVPRPGKGRPMEFRQKEIREEGFYDTVTTQDPREMT